MRVAIIHDQLPPNARADEADALVQANVVADALSKLGHESIIIEATLDLNEVIAELGRCEPNLAFNLTESLGGHARLIHVIPGLLDALEVPYTGVSAEAQFCTSNKLIAKRMMQSSSLPTPPWHTLESLSEEHAIESARYIIKSVWEHASVGLDEDSVVRADARRQLQQAIENRLEILRGEGFAEMFIDGREFNIALLADSSEPEVLPPAEIDFEGYDKDKPRVVGYRAKWDEQSFEYHHTPRRYDFPDSDAALLANLRDLALKCWSVFNLVGYVRVDFRVDHKNQPWILEINTNPCLSPDAGFAAALNRAGISFEQAIERIVTDAINKPRNHPAVASAV